MKRTVLTILAVSVGVVLLLVAIVAALLFGPAIGEKLGLVQTPTQIPANVRIPTQTATPIRNSAFEITLRCESADETEGAVSVLMSYQLTTVSGDLFSVTTGLRLQCAEPHPFTLIGTGLTVRVEGSEGSYGVVVVQIKRDGQTVFQDSAGLNQGSITATLQ